MSAGSRFLLVIFVFLVGALVVLVSVQLQLGDFVTVVVFLATVGLVFWLWTRTAKRR